MKNTKRLYSLVILFALTVVGLSWIFSPSREFSTQERRPLAQWPEFTWSDFISGDYFADVDSALADQFPARNEFLSLKSTAQMLVGKADNGRVYFAQEDYLIEKNGELNLQQLNNNVDILMRFHEEYQAEFEQASFILAPTVAGVAPELLPKNHLETDQAVTLASINNLTVENGLISSKLIEALDSGDYFRTDHHWTQTGAKEAFELWRAESRFDEIAVDYEQLSISETFYGTTWAKGNSTTISPDTVEAYLSEGLDHVELYDIEVNHIRNNIYNEDALGTSDVYEYFLGRNEGYLKIVTQAEAGEGDLLIFKDSYANAFIPFLVPYFETITVIDLRYLAEPMSNIMAGEDFTDLIYLYNIVTFSSESNIFKILQ